VCQLSSKSLEPRPRYVSFNIMLVWLENAYARPFLGSFGGTFPQMMSLIVLTPKRTILGLNHVIWEINREYRSHGSSWAIGARKKDRTGKKSQKGYISPICGEAPTEAMYMKICVVGDVLDVITCAKFQNEFLWVAILQGVEFSIFPIDFEWALQQCSATALPVMMDQDCIWYCKHRYTNTLLFVFSSHFCRHTYSVLLLARLHIV